MWSMDDVKQQGRIQEFSIGAAFPLRPYVAKLAQHFEKLAEQILWEWVKKMPFLDNLANF